MIRGGGKAEINGDCFWFLIFVCLGTHSTVLRLNPNYAQGSLLAVFGGPYGVSRIKPRRAKCKSLLYPGPGPKMEIGNKSPFGTNDQFNKKYLQLP